MSSPSEQPIAIPKARNSFALYVASCFARAICLSKEERQQLVKDAARDWNAMSDEEKEEYRRASKEEFAAKRAATKEVMARQRTPTPMERQRRKRMKRKSSPVVPSPAVPAAVNTAGAVSTVGCASTACPALSSAAGLAVYTRVVRKPGLTAVGAAGPAAGHASSPGAESTACPASARTACPAAQAMKPVVTREVCDDGDGGPPRRMSQDTINKRSELSPLTHLGGVWSVDTNSGAALGRGSYGTVLRVHHSRTMRICAAKVFMDGKSSCCEEVRVYRSLADRPHPAFLDLLDFSVGGGMSWIVTPWCVSGCLASYLKSGSRLGRHIIMGFGNQVRSGLEHLHFQAGWLHLDIKPANIMWDPATHYAHIIDFSMAERWPITANAQVQDQWCTEVYRPPELFSFKFSPITFLRPAVDSWGLGCTLVEASAGQRLFRPGVYSIKEQVLAFARNPDKLLDHLDLPTNAMTVVRRLLHGNPNHRRGLAEAFPVD